MKRSWKEIGAVLGLMAMSAFVAWPVWKMLYLRGVEAALYERAQSLVQKHPELAPAWEIALQDDVLTQAEADVILEAAAASDRTAE